mmetsp:Transcript_3005/g.9199  ORF Transcript_3005/g.9199 Transcript_3005/m.9199 type:complete len:97 (+) Transcript_3005:42-332(+)
MAAFVSTVVVGRSAAGDRKTCRVVRSANASGARRLARVNMAAETEDKNSPAPPPKDSYVKLAMRNMVQQGGKAVLHFGMTASVMLVFFVGLAYLTK